MFSFQIQNMLIKTFSKNNQIKKCMYHIVPERVWPLIEVMPVNNFAPRCNAVLEAMQFQVHNIKHGIQ